MSRRWDLVFQIFENIAGRRDKWHNLTKRHKILHIDRLQDLQHRQFRGLQGLVHHFKSLTVHSSILEPIHLDIEALGR
jgi:hypothetical protein